MTLRTRSRAALILLLAASPAALRAQQRPAGHEPGEVAAVLEAVDRYMLAISANDLAAMEALQTPEGMTYRARRGGDGAWSIQALPNLAWVAPSRRDGRAFRERYWQPTVLVRGPLAVVWAPYEFWVAGETSHCGVDVFNLIRAEDGWRVANAMWTVEPEACAELRPADPAAIRPR